MSDDPDAFEKWLYRQTISDSLRLVWSDAMRRVLETAWDELDALADEREIHQGTICKIMDKMWEAACNEFRLR
jgi:hypothetical protein